MEYATVLKNYLDADGKLKQYPTKRKYRVPALFFLAEGIEAGRVYTEQEIGEAICERHSFSDPSMLRRELYEMKFIDRQRDGSAYWKREEQPTMANFGMEE